MSILFVFQFRAAGDTLALAVGYCLVFLSINYGLRGHSGFSCRVLSDLFVCQLQALGDTLAPAVGYCLVLLSVNLWSRETLGQQLSGIVCFFRLSISGLWGHSSSSCQVLFFFVCLLISGLRGHSGSSRRVLSDLFVCQFRASGDTLPRAVKVCLIFLSALSVCPS